MSKAPIIFVLLLAVSSTLVWGQAYPSRPIRMVVPQPPGGASDTFSRVIAQRISTTLGQPVVVDNRPGAGGLIGTDFVSKSVPDGYTILVTFGSHHLMPFVSKSLPFDAVQDFTPIIAGALTPFCLVVNTSIQSRTALEFIDYVRKNPGKVAYASPGSGSTSHLAGELINFSTKVDMLHVPYKGGAPAIADLAAGQISVGIFVLSTIAPHVRSGKLRILGCVEGNRAKAAPDIPTLAEAGVPGFPLPESWIGMLGPSGLSSSVISRLNSEILAALNSQEVRERLEAIGLEVTGNTPEQFRATITRNTEIYKRVVAQSRIKPE